MLRDPLDQVARTVLGSLRQNDGELIAAEAGRRVGGAAALAQTLADATQRAIADQMPPSVVDLLESVHVEQQRRERAACALRPADLSLQRVHEVAVVYEPRQLILDRLRACEPLRLALLPHHCGGGE